MASQPSPVTSAVIAWAVAEDGRDVDQIADALKVDVDTLSGWTNGALRPSRGQVTLLAKTLNRPRALFFLPAPPVAASLPASFRHPPGDGAREVGPEARRRVRQARRVQRAVSWALRDESPVEVPLRAIADSPEQAADEARRWLGVSDEDQRIWRDGYQALAAWRDALDNGGVLVFASEIGADDVRGFSAWDEQAPLIVANISAVSPEARCFTLAHELGHLVLRKDATCLELRGDLSDAAVERWCEAFGASLLMPRGAVLSLTRSLGVDDQSADLDDVRAIAAAFRASHRAAALRLIDLGLARRSLYAAVVAAFRPKPSTPTDPRTPFRRPARSTLRQREYGPRALRTVLQDLPPRDALSVLRVTVDDVRRIADEVPGVPAF